MVANERVQNPAGHDYVDAIALDKVGEVGILAHDWHTLQRAMRQAPDMRHERDITKADKE